MLVDIMLMLPDMAPLLMVYLLIVGMKTTTEQRRLVRVLWLLDMAHKPVVREQWP